MHSQRLQQSSSELGPSLSGARRLHHRPAPLERRHEFASQDAARSRAAMSPHGRAPDRCPLQGNADICTPRSPAIVPRPASPDCPETRQIALLQLLKHHSRGVLHNGLVCRISMPCVGAIQDRRIRSGCGAGCGVRGVLRPWSASQRRESLCSTVQPRRLVVAHPVQVAVI